MNYPTPEEIRLAHDAINADGPMAEATIRLGALVLHDPILKRIVRRMSRDAVGRALPPDVVILGAIVTGLNYGLRIHEQRMAAGAREAADAAG